MLDYSDVVEALGNHRNRYLLLGNGFSIALFPDIFTYGSLYKNAKISDYPSLEKVFKALKTEDFEYVIKNLVTASKIAFAYEGSNSKLGKQFQKDAESLKIILVNAIARHHPERPYDISDKAYAHCRGFVNYYSNVYTLNYDVLLYWSLMQDEVDELKLFSDDGFRHDQDNDDAPWVTWQQGHKANIYNLHGALHLFDIETEIIKFTWSRTEVPIIEQLKNSLDQEKYPLFVAEGSSKSKRSRILHNAYLHKAFRSFEACADKSNSAFVIYGHSLDDNDKHILKALEKGNVSDLFVSIYGDAGSEQNKKIISRAEKIAEKRLIHNERRPINVQFFDAASAKVWG